MLRDSRKKRNTEYPGIQLKPIKPNDLDRTSVNKDAALHFLRHITEQEMAKSLLAYDVRLFRIEREYYTHPMDLSSFPIIVAIF